MQQRISIVTLGVRNLEKARNFYDALGWQVHSEDMSDKIVCYNLQNMAFALYPVENMSEEIALKTSEAGFNGIVLAHNVASKEDVSTVLEEAEKVGGKIVKPAQDAFWGGHSGYFSDPDGYLWEVAYNPFSPLGADGEFQWGGVKEKEAA